MTEFWFRKKICYLVLRKTICYEGVRRHDKVVRQERELEESTLDIDGCVLGSEEGAQSTVAVFEKDTAQLQGVSGL